MLPKPVDWLAETIKQGLALFGLQEQHAGEIVGIRLIPSRLGVYSKASTPSAARRS